MKNVKVSVTEFALPVPRKGSIDSFSGFGRASKLGQEIHHQVQSERKKEFPQYRPEELISASFECGDFEFELGGRMDGFFDEAKPRIEEIKSNFNVYELFRRLKDAKDEHPYCLQLKTYGYLYYKNHGVMPELNLHLVSSRDDERMDLTLHLDLPSFEAWFQSRLEELVEDAKRAEKRAKRRRKASTELTFPFADPRSGQMELMHTIEKNLETSRPLMIQAPTGLGKTMGVLFPTLKEALSRGQQVIYITPKNSQHGVAQDAIERLQDTGAKIKALTITAKSKICFKAEAVCNPDYCEYARDHYTKLAANKTLEKLAKKKNLTTRTFRKVAEEDQVCPFEIQLDTAREADAVICDYNYVFAPQSALGRLTTLELDQDGKANLIIDEAHNLPSRSMDYYSPTLSVQALERMREDVKDLDLRFQKEVNALLTSCIDVVKECGPKDATKPCKIDPPVGDFLLQDEKLRTYLSGYLKSDVDIKPGDVVLRLTFYWSEFTQALEFITSGRLEFFATFNPKPAAIRITCCDASEMLKDCYKDYDHVTAFSATLKPFKYYSELSGLAGLDVQTSEFSSPFPPQNRKLLIIPQISSKYSERERNYPRIAETISRISALKRGNYFAFFPSFEFMERVCNLFEAPEGFLVLKQERHMKRDQVEAILECLRQENAAYILFAVQGGVFSEGVDYPGRMSIGAFVVGPPLPNFDLERETMREYYQEHYAAGFDYAYTYPAMAKAVQAAGRVIRSENDKGIIVLMDNRFIQTSYSKSMPADWYDLDPKELVSQKILEEITEFWARNPLEAKSSQAKSNSKNSESDWAEI